MRTSRQEWICQGPDSFSPRLLRGLCGVPSSAAASPPLPLPSSLQLPRKSKQPSASSAIALVNPSGFFGKPGELLLDLWPLLSICLCRRFTLTLGDPLASQLLCGPFWDATRLPAETAQASMARLCLSLLALPEVQKPFKRLQTPQLAQTPGPPQVAHFAAPSPSSRTRPPCPSAKPHTPSRRVHSRSDRILRQQPNK